MISIKIESKSTVPVYRQIYEGMRALILDGTLRPGQRVPSTRELSTLLSISRTTASQAYDYLISEGYLATTKASRTYVRRELPEAFLAPARSNGSLRTDQESEPGSSRMSVRDAAVAGKGGRSTARAKQAYPFSALAGMLMQKQSHNNREPDNDRTLKNISSNSPSVRDFPVVEWRSCINNVLRNAGSSVLEYSGPDGCIELRKAISRYLQLSRGVVCDWQQVIVTSASKQALDLVCRLHVQPGACVAIEEPGYAGAVAAFRASGCRLIAMPVDGLGLATGRLLRGRANPKLLYTTPSHQYPTGGTMPLDRRIELLQWASETGALIIEDDYDSEFRYTGHPVPSLQGLARGRGIVYVGTLSKVLFPSLRLGYVVVPEELQDLYRQAQNTIYGDPPAIEQEAAALLMKSGALERHIRKMRLLYANRRTVALDELSRLFGEDLAIIGDAAGLHFCLRFRQKIDKQEFEGYCADAGFLIKNTDSFYFNQTSKDRAEYTFGFGRLNETEIRLAAKALNRAYHRCVG